jgi:3-methyladenine DNA glycosylase/8-oxoguanine DNA glycosylase
MIPRSEADVAADALRAKRAPDAFGTLIVLVVGQQLSVSARRTIVSRLQQRFGGHLP